MYEPSFVRIKVFITDISSIQDAGDQLIKRSDLSTPLLKTVNHKLIQFGCCYIAIVTAPRFSPLIRLMEPNALTHAAGYEFLVPLMDSEDITALPSLSGTSLGQSEHRVAVCNHGDRRTRTDHSVLREKWPEFEYTHVPVLAKERYKKPVKLCWTVHSYTILTPCQHVRCLFYFSSTL